MGECDCCCGRVYLGSLCVFLDNMHVSTFPILISSNLRENSIFLPL